MSKMHHNGTRLMLSALTVAVLSACGGSSKTDEIVVPPVATAPVAQADTAVSLNGAVIEIDVLANDTAGSGGALTLTSVTAPTKGEVAIVNNKIQYTPSATFLGSDSFSYTVTSGTLTATTAVSVAGHQTLNLAGRVIDSPIADASVEVNVNGETFSATADSQGFYQLTILLTEALGDELLRLSAQGAETNNQGFVTLSSLTTSAAELLALRQGEQSVGRDQLDALQITQLTTAKDLLIKQLVGEQALTAAQLAEAEVSLDADKLIQTAAAIKLLVDNPSFSLPEGYSTIEQFVADTQVFEQFITSASEGENSPLSQAIAATLADSDVTPAAQPIIGNYMQVFDSPLFITPRSLMNFNFSVNAVSFTSNTGASAGSGEFENTTKDISLAGSSITVVDPNKTGYQNYVRYQPINNFISDEAELNSWNQQGCPAQAMVTTYSGYERFTVLEQTDTDFIAAVDTFSNQVPDNPGQDHEHLSHTLA